MQDGICPFIQKECMYSKCMLFNDANGCAFESTPVRLENIEKELQLIKNAIKAIDLRTN